MNNCSSFLLAAISFIQLDIWLRTLGDIRELQVTARSLCYDSRHGIFVAIEKCMINICRHCDEVIAGKAYRVTSEEDGVPLLNMVVCASCAAVAKSLLLNTEEITPEYRTPSAAVSDVSDLLL